MSFSARDLSVLAYANNFTLWHYTTTDQDVSAPDYFKSAGKDMFRTNDLMIAQTDTEGQPQTKFYIVFNKDGVVTIHPYA